MYLPFSHVLCMPVCAYKVHFETAILLVLLAGAGLKARKPTVSAVMTLQPGAAVAS